MLFKQWLKQIDGLFWARQVRPARPHAGVSFTLEHQPGCAVDPWERLGTTSPLVLVRTRVIEHIGKESSPSISVLRVRFVGLDVCL